MASASPTSIYLVCVFTSIYFVGLVRFVGGLNLINNSIFCCNACFQLFLFYFNCLLNVKEKIKKKYAKKMQKKKTIKIAGKWLLPQIITSAKNNNQIMHKNKIVYYQKK